MQFCVVRLGTGVGGTRLQVCRPCAVLHGRWGGWAGQGCRRVGGHVQSCNADGVCWGDTVAGV